MSDEFTIKDSGARQEFASGMVRDTTEGKVDYTSCRIGPMFERWNAHLTKGRQKYPDVAPGVPNWTLASGEAELARAKESAARHFEAWLRGDRDEDHAAGVFFNINLAEYVRGRLHEEAAYDDDVPYIAEPASIPEFEPIPTPFLDALVEHEGDAASKWVAAPKPVSPEELTARLQEALDRPLNPEPAVVPPYLPAEPSPEGDEFDSYTRPLGAKRLDLEHERRERNIPDLGGREFSEDDCGHMSVDGWFCERLPGHEGKCAAPSQYTLRRWDPPKPVVGTPSEDDVCDCAGCRP